VCVEAHAGVVRFEGATQQPVVSFELSFEDGTREEGRLALRRCPQRVLCG
jgi:hypothetical protein